MKTISSFEAIKSLAQTGNLYVRWSRGPAKDKAQGYSRDYVSGGSHDGLSAQCIDPMQNPDSISAMMLVEYRFLRRKDSKIYGWLFFGQQNGTDSDNAPTVDADSIVVVGRLADGMIEALSDYSDAYWAAARAGWRMDAPNLIEHLGQYK